MKRAGDGWLWFQIRREVWPMKTREQLPQVLRDMADTLARYLENRAPEIPEKTREEVVMAITGYIRGRWKGLEIIFKKRDLDRIEHEKQLRFFF